MTEGLRKIQSVLNLLSSLIAVMAILYGGLIAIGMDIPTPVKNRQAILLLKSDLSSINKSIEDDRRSNIRFQNIMLSVTCTRLTEIQLDLIPECASYRRR